MAHIQEEHGDEISVTSHLHIVCEILYCYCGNMTVHVGTASHSFQEGELIVIPANIVHSIDFHGQIEHHYLVVQFLEYAFQILVLHLDCYYKTQFHKL